MNGMINGQSPNTNNVGYMFSRAPGFFDEVCFTTPSSGTITVTHNLGVTPQLAITKLRSGASQFWVVNSETLASDRYLVLNTNADSASAGSLFYTASSTTVTFTAGYLTANSAYVQYLFATVAGVSKVGSYTGNGTTQTINCGFTGGARWVLIKRTNNSGNWYVYDTLRGMTVLTDPYLLMNAPAAAEVATLGSVTTVSTGFALNSAILADINVNGGTYIFLAIA
jgi:hypothetical protein